MRGGVESPSEQIVSTRAWLQTSSNCKRGKTGNFRLKLYRQEKETLGFLPRGLHPIQAFIRFLGSLIYFKIWTLCLSVCLSICLSVCLVAFPTLTIVCGSFFLFFLGTLLIIIFFITLSNFFESSLITFFQLHFKKFCGDEFKLLL